jgi:DNA helicase II / ATP-dependent DNA helicase PcrA
VPVVRTQPAVSQTTFVRPAPRTDPLADLNPQQRAAVEHGIDSSGELPSPLLVIAGAGSGKTMTLAARVARLVLQGADPQRLLLMTFSRRAAAEMAARAGRLLQQSLGLPAHLPVPALPWCGTFHSVGARLLREHAASLGLAPNFTVLGRADAQDLMAMVRVDLGLHRGEQRFPLAPTCLAIHSRAINSQAPLAELLRAVYPWCETHADALRGLFVAFAAEKQRQQLLDYDDLLLVWLHLMNDPALATRVAGRFDHVLVDEYQDTNRLQADILHRLKPDGRGLVVVGDDAQAIYAFRAAEVRNMLEFPLRFEPPARVLTLERNYRSTQPILAASNAVIGLASERFTKNLWSDRISSCRPQLVSVEDEAAQARWVADEVLAQREQGITLKRQAVLFRTQHHSAALELELVRRRIPFVKFGGLRFLEAAHIKDVLSVLRWADNPQAALAGFRVARLVPGLGSASVKRLLADMTAVADPASALLSWRPPPAARDEWAAFQRLYAALRAPAGWPDALALAVRWYLPQLRRLHDDHRVREADLEQLMRLARGYTSSERFLTELTLDPPAATSDEAGPPHRDEDYLILSTIHSAKGREWNVVFVLNVVDGCMPADMATGNAAEIEEERRLLYVAMTRAKDRLHLLVPQRFHVTQQRAHGDRHLYASLSRFVPPGLAGHFELIGPATPDRPADVADNGPPLFDAMQRLRDHWA